MNQLSRRFVRWGTTFLVLGAWTGYGPFHHYLHGNTTPSCPYAPVHAHVVLLGWVGMTLFGLVYRALPDWGAVSPASRKLAGVHFGLSAVSILGVFANGIFGYQVLNHISPGFYYEPDRPRLMTWQLIDGGFLTLFAVGSVLFMIVVFRVSRVR